MEITQEMRRMQACVHTVYKVLCICARQVVRVLNFTVSNVVIKRHRAAHKLRRIFAISSL